MTLLKPNSDKLKIIFAGTPEFAATTLAALLESKHDICAVYTQPDRPAGRGRKLTPSPVKQLAIQHQLPVYQPQTLRDEEAQQQLATLDADVMVVVAYGLILPQAVLEIPRQGCLNIHASLLPRWRGAAPIQRAIEAGDAESGVTIMQMDVGLDTGNMLHTASCTIKDDDTAQTLHNRLAKIGAEALLTVLQQLLDHTVTPISQDNALANYAHKMEKREAEIVWQQDALQLSRRIRAFNPWPVCFTQWNGKPLRILMAQPLTEKSDQPPGTVIREGADGIDVTCGEGLLRITTLQIAGKRATSAAEFIHSRSLLGSVLGQLESK